MAVSYVENMANLPPQTLAHHDAESQAQIHAMQDKIDELQARLREREEEHSRLQSSSAARDRVCLYMYLPFVLICLADDDDEKSGSGDGSSRLVGAAVESRA